MTTGPLSGTSATPLVIAAHGTRDAEGEAVCRALADRVQALLPDRRVALGFVELSSPSCELLVWPMEYSRSPRISDICRPRPVTSEPLMTSMTAVLAFLDVVPVLSAALSSVDGSVDVVGVDVGAPAGGLRPKALATFSA